VAHRRRYADAWTAEYNVLLRRRHPQKELQTLLELPQVPANAGENFFLILFCWQSSESLRSCFSTPAATFYHFPLSLLFYTLSHAAIRLWSKKKKSYQKTCVASQLLVCSLATERSRNISVSFTLWFCFCTCHYAHCRGLIWAFLY